MRKGYRETMPKRSHDDEGKPIYGAPVGARTAGSQGATRSEIEAVIGSVPLRVLVQQEGDGSWVARVPALAPYAVFPHFRSQSRGSLHSASTKHGAIKAACDAVSIDATSANDSGSDPDPKHTSRLFGFDPGRERVAAWMRGQGFATGHGDTLEDLLSELVWQAGEMGDG